MAALDFPFPANIGDKYPVPGIPNKPVYIFDGVKWTTHGEIVDDVIGASAITPLMNAGDGAVGTEANWSHGDHVHPAKVATPALGDSSTLIATTAFVASAIGVVTGGTALAPINNPAFTGNPTAPTPPTSDNDTSVATTAYVNAVVNNATIQKVLTTATPPVGVPNGSLWWNTTDGLLYIYYADVDSTQWVLASPLPRSA